MNHEEFQAAYLEGRVGSAERSHLDGCFECSQALPGLDATRATLADDATWDTPPSELEERLVAAIAGEPAERPTRRWIWLAAPAAAAAIVIGGWIVTRSPAADWQIDLPGVHQAAAASGTVQGWNDDAGTRMVVRVEDLEPAPDGFVYEFWLSQGSQHISAGTFTEASNVELWAGVRRADYPRLWVTLEPLDDDPAPSPEVVLDTG